MTTNKPILNDDLIPSFKYHGEQLFNLLFVFLLECQFLEKAPFF